jgi:serine/threonine protein kinase
LTESAALLGSLRYMAPEQRWGKADDRSDLYALGVVLHECLSGGVPGEQPLPSSVPAYLVKFIEQLTAQNPSARPLSAVEAATRLGQLRKGSLSKLVVGGAVGGVAVVIGVVLLLAGGPSDTSADRTPERAAMVHDAGLDGGLAPVDAGSALEVGEVDAGSLQPTGFLTVRTLGVESVIIDDRPPVALRDILGRPLVVEPLTIGVAVGSHSVVFNCPSSGKVKGSRSSLPFIVKVPEFPAAEVTWNCATMRPMTKADRLKAASAVKPPPGKPPPVKAPPTKPLPKPVEPGVKKKAPTKKEVP